MLICTARAEEFSVALGQSHDRMGEKQAELREQAVKREAEVKQNRRDEEDYRELSIRQFKVRLTSMPDM